MRMRSRQPLVLILLFAILAAAVGFSSYRHFRTPLVDTVSKEAKAVSESAKSVSNNVTQAVSIGLAQRDVTSAFHKHRLNFVILGAQEDEGTTDSIILAHVDLDRRLATLISIPRDSWVPIPGHGFQKINAAYAFGGAELAGKVVGKLLGAHVDATITVDPVGAKQIVDAMGGLNINVEHDMDYDDNYGNLHIHLKKGEQFLNGGQVLEYIRYRHDVESDWGRMRRQQQVVHEIARELGEPQNWTKIPRLITLMRKDVQTSLSDPQIQALIELYRGVPTDNVRTLTLPGRADFVGDVSVVLVDERWAKVIGQVVCSPNDPPAGAVLIANASGVPNVSQIVVSALRGGGWNVQSAIDEPTKARSTVVGSAVAAQRLALTFSDFARRPGNQTVLEFGADAQPKI
jgi:LCP family protein required for cell wall assembly